MPNWMRGDLVLHPRKPEWGPGKVVKVEPKAVQVYWRDRGEPGATRIVLSAMTLERAPSQQDSILDNLPPLVDKDGTLALPIDGKIMTVRAATERFLEHFPLGFEDPRYFKLERTYKWEAHQQFRDTFAEGRFRTMLVQDAPRLCDELKRSMRSINLMSPYEKTALADALDQPDQCVPFLERLADVLECGEARQDLQEPLFRAVENLPVTGLRVATWPVATFFPFLENPRVHMFLKPSVTQQAASTLGFHLNYQASLNWLTYSRLLEMSRVYREQIASLAPRDQIDIQSFFWVTCGGYEEVKP